MNAITRLVNGDPSGDRVASGMFDNSPFEALTDELARLDVLIQRVSDRQYSARQVGPFESSIGTHVRHCLDHVAAFLGGVQSGQIDYDLRHRRTVVESSRREAHAKIKRLQSRTQAARTKSMDRPIRLTALLTKDGPTVEVESSVGRELVFTLSHTTHHNAMIGAMAKLLGIDTPPDFGVAPSTAAYHDRARCAQ